MLVLKLDMPMLLPPLGILHGCMLFGMPVNMPVDMLDSDPLPDIPPMPIPGMPNPPDVLPMNMPPE
jgi:hypothetical protein